MLTTGLTECFYSWEEKREDLSVREKNFSVLNESYYSLHVYLSLLRIRENIFFTERLKM